MDRQVKEMVKNDTLAEVLGEASQPSALLDRIRAICGDQDPVRCLQQLGVNRGCRHYDGAFQPPTTFPEEIDALSNEEAGIALCLGALAYDHTGIRVGAELLSSEICKPGRIIQLTLQEHCQTVVGYIARCGKQAEPENLVWEEILTALAPIREAPPGSLPHWTRFVSMTGITPNGGGPSIVWLRPHPDYQQLAQHPFGNRTMRHP